MLKVYTKLFEQTETKNLGNHISYWMLVTVLIETHTLEDLD